MDNAAIHKTQEVCEFSEIHSHSVYIDNDNELCRTYLVTSPDKWILHNLQDRVLAEVIACGINRLTGTDFSNYVIYLSSQFDEIPLFRTEVLNWMKK